MVVGGMRPYLCLALALSLGACSAATIPPSAGRGLEAVSTVHSRIAIPAQELFVVACDGSVADGTASGFATETQQQLPSGTHLTQTFRLTWQALAGNANAQFTGTTTFVAVRQVQQLTVTGHAQLFQNHRLYDV